MIRIDTNRFCDSGCINVVPNVEKVLALKNDIFHHGSTIGIVSRSTIGSERTTILDRDHHKDIVHVVCNDVLAERRRSGTPRTNKVEEVGLVFHLRWIKGRDLDMRG